MSAHLYTPWHYVNFIELNYFSVVSCGSSVWTLWKTNTFIHLVEMIHFPHSSFLPYTTHMFPLLHRVLGLWIPPESSLGSRAKTATLSLLYQTGVKSTNRLLWPNMIKLQPGSGQFTAHQFCLSSVSCISTEQQLSVLLLKKDFITIRPGLAESCGITLLWRACLTHFYSWWLSGSEELRRCSSYAVSVWGPSSSYAQKKSQMCVSQHICADGG